MELKTKRDFRVLGVTIDECWEKIAESEYGKYAITKDQKEIFKVIEGMYFIQRHFNKGVRILGFEGNSHQIEIFDIQESERITEEAMKNFRI
jgi:hypothetical protein